MVDVILKLLYLRFDKYLHEQYESKLTEMRNGFEAVQAVEALAKKIEAPRFIQRPGSEYIRKQNTRRQNCTI